MRFRDVQHQDRALSILRRALASGRTHHAYLFEGPDGVGKEMAARALAARLLCEGVDAEAGGLFGGAAPAGDGLAFDACGECRSCRIFLVGNHPDFHVIERALHKKHPDRSVRNRKGLELTIDVIRHFLLEHAAASPTLGQRRVFLIRDAEVMNTEAQNCLLKTLEEPPGRSCLILVSSSAARLLPTIRSRCQLIPFGLLPPVFVREQVQALARIDAESAAALAGLSQGRLGAALHWHRIGLLATVQRCGALLTEGFAERPEPFGKALIELATELVVRTNDAARGEAPSTETPAVDAEDTDDADEDEDAESAAKPSAKTVATDQLRDALKLVLLSIATILRDALVTYSAGSGGRTATLLPGDVAAPERVAARLGPYRLNDAIAAIASAERMIDRNVAPSLAMERLAVTITGEATVV